jgi:hypothetical protein
MTLIETIAEAERADDLYSAAVRAAGFKSRWEMPGDIMRVNDRIREAYNAKVAADAMVRVAFELSRKP